MTLLADALRLLVLLAGGFLAGLCVYRWTRVDSSAVRWRIVGLGTLGVGNAVLAVWRLGGAFNPGSAIVLAGLVISIVGMMGQRAGDDPNHPERTT